MSGAKIQSIQQNISKNDLNSRYSTDAKGEMTNMLELPGTDIKAAIIKILKEIR